MDHLIRYTRHGTPDVCLNCSCVAIKVSGRLRGLILSWSMTSYGTFHYTVELRFSLTFCITRNAPLNWNFRLEGRRNLDSHLAWFVCHCATSIWEHVVFMRSKNMLMSPFKDNLACRTLGWHHSFHRIGHWVESFPWVKLQNGYVD